MCMFTKEAFANLMYVDMLTSSRSCKSDAAFRVNVANLYLQELTAAEEEQVEEDKEKQLQVSVKLLYVYST